MTTTAELREDMMRRGLPPAALPLAEAAAYVGLSPRTFLREVAAGKLPKPLDLSGRPSREDGECAMVQTSKQSAGRLLDGREWNEYPAPATEAVPA